MRIASGNHLPGFQQLFAVFQAVGVSSPTRV